MTIEKNLEGSTLTVGLTGRLDTVSTPELEEALSGSLEGVDELVLDFSGLEYLSSAGLRLLLQCYKKMTAKNGGLTIRNVNDTIFDIFEITGFSDILTVK